MKKTTLYIIVGLVILMIAAGIGIYFYTQRKKKPQQDSKKVADILNIETTVSKPYDNEAKALVETFFKNSGLGVEQQAAMLEAAQENMKKNGKVDGIIATMAQWLPAWIEDPKHAEIKDKIEAAWSAAYKKWSELKAKHAL